MSKIRNPFALHAKKRNASIFKDKRIKRIKNKERKELENNEEETDDSNHDSDLYTSEYEEW